MPRIDQPVMMPEIGSPYKYFQISRAVAWSDIQPGTLVQYRYYWLWHHAIVSESNESARKIKVIHYGTDHLFARRTIMEDTLRVDLRHHDLWVYRSDPTRSNSHDVIVQKARSRLGEQRWRRGNRSWDFCRECVLKKRVVSLTRD